MTGALHVRRVARRVDLEACWVIRRAVFVDEQLVPLEEEIDDLDLAPSTVHVLAEEVSPQGTLPLATARLLPSAPGVVRIGRVAVLKDARGNGAGRAVMAAMHRIAADEHRADGVVRVDIEAQEHAIPFYTRLGYELVDERRYLDAGIWHRDMALVLTD